MNDLAQEYWSEPMWITPAGFAAFLMSQDKALQRADSSVSEDRKPLYTVSPSKVATISVSGPIMRGGQGWFMDELTNIEDVAAAVEEVDSDPSIKAVNFLFNTPGGSTSMIAETAHRISQMGKPTRAIVDQQMASAGYFLGAAVNSGIFATQGAMIGSIGTYLPYVDLSKRFENAGVKVDLIKSGDYKGIGYPGTSLSDQGRAYLQDRVDAMNSMFQGFVSLQRPLVSLDDMQGQCFLAGEAMSKGLCDYVGNHSNDFMQIIS